MKWFFCNFSDTGMSHCGAGRIEVGYELDRGRWVVFLNVKDWTAIDNIYCDTEEIALKTAKRLYLDFIKYRLSDKQVLLIEDTGIEIINIETGYSQTLSNKAVAKLKEFIK